MVPQPVRGRVGLLADRPSRGSYIGAGYTSIDTGQEWSWNGAAWHDVTASRDPSNMAISPNFITSRWFTARDEADTRRVLMHFWGGSNTHGAPGNDPDPLNDSWPGRVIANVQPLYGDGGSGYLNGYTNSTTGTWTIINGMASVGYRADAAASMRWENLRGRRIRLWHRNRPGDGSFRWRIDEGAWRTVNPPTGFGAEPGVDWFADDFTTLADVPHTVDVEWVSGEVVIYGLMADRATGIVPCRCAIGGRAVSQFGLGRLARFNIGITDTSTTITSTAPGVFTSAMEGRYLISGVDLEAATIAGLPLDARIDTVTDAETAIIDNPATATDTITVDLCINPMSYSDFPRQTVLPGLTFGLGLADVVLAGWGLNDMAAMGGAEFDEVNTDRFREGASSLLKAYYSSNDVGGQTYTPTLVVIGEHLGTLFGDPLRSGPQIVAAAKQFAIGFGGAYIDFWERYDRSFQRASDEGVMADVIHVNNDGAQTWADLVLDVLTRPT